MIGRWTVEESRTGMSMLITPNGYRVAMMTHARAKGIAAALNTEEGRKAFERARNEP